MHGAKIGDHTTTVGLLRDRKKCKVK